MHSDMRFYTMWVSSLALNQ